MYNWLSFENDCASGIKVVFVPYNPGYGSSSMDLGPGRHNATGWPRAIVEQKGGYELYVCPMDYIPVDANDNYIDRVNMQYRCKQQ